MKSVSQVILLVFFSFLYGQKSFKNILKSDNINEIEIFLKTAHPDDPKRIVLKKKLIALKNSSWAKPGIGASMAARSIESYDITQSYAIGEKEEFDLLISETSSQHKEKTIQLLNALFATDTEGESATLLIQNRTECNIILRIQPKTNDKIVYNLAVKGQAENFITLKKGQYLIKGKVCGELYSSEKELNKSLLIELK